MCDMFDESNKRHDSRARCSLAVASHKDANPGFDGVAIAIRDRDRKSHRVLLHAIGYLRLMWNYKRSIYFTI
jgi:hypothetical protein